MVEVAFALLALWFGIRHFSNGFFFFLFATILMWDAARNLGWKLQVSQEQLRVSRYFRWTTINWDQVRVIEISPTWGRGQEAMKLGLLSKETVNLGSIHDCVFAHFA